MNTEKKKEGGGPLHDLLAKHSSVMSGLSRLEMKLEDKAPDCLSYVEEIYRHMDACAEIIQEIQNNKVNER